MARRGHPSLFSLQHEITARCTLLIVEHDMSVVFGLADRVVPDDQVYAASLEFCRQFVGGPAVALRAAKEAIDRGTETDLESGLALERTYFAAMFATKDREIGMESFVANGPGKAVFEGR